TAFWKTRNPLFPFGNATFVSPDLERSIRTEDHTFHQPLTWRTAYDITFHTHDYFEGQDGSVGFQYLILVPLGILGAFMVRGRAGIAAVIGIGAAALVVWQLPNARYVYPALP